MLIFIACVGDDIGSGNLEVPPSEPYINIEVVSTAGEAHGARDSLASSSQRQRDRSPEMVSY